MPQVDIDIEVDEDEAINLMFHHLRLAAAFFEATPDDITDALARIPTYRGQPHFTAPAMEAWLRAMEGLY